MPRLVSTGTKPPSKWMRTSGASGSSGGSRGPPPVPHAARATVAAASIPMVLLAIWLRWRLSGRRFPIAPPGVRRWERSAGLAFPTRQTLIHQVEGPVELLLGGHQGRDESNDI